MVGGNMGDMVGGNMGASVHVRHTTQTTSATSTRATSIPQDPFPCPRSADNAGAAALVFLATKGNSVEDRVVFLANAGGIPPIVALVRNGNGAQKASISFSKPRKMYNFSACSHVGFGLLCRVLRSLPGQLTTRTRRRDRPGRGRALARQRRSAPS